MSQRNTTIVAPGGGVNAGPLTAQTGTVTATVDPDRIAAGRRMFEPVGDYPVPDVLSTVRVGQRLALGASADPGVLHRSR